MRRVVVTGMGLATPLGSGVDHVWRRLIAGDSGIRKIESFDVSDMPCQVGGQVPLGQGPGLLDMDAIIPPKDQRKTDPFVHFALAAADEAVRQSGWMPGEDRDEDRCRTGVMIGSGIGGLLEIFETSKILAEKGPRRVSPFFIPASLINLASGQVSIRWGFKGPNHSVVTACSTGAHAIGDAARLIQWGDADVMVAGGAEAGVNRLGYAGFCAARAMSSGYNDRPTEASRPFDEGRDGFVMGEGAGIVVLEALEHAQARGAKILAEIIGYGMSGDAYHVTSPAPDGNGGFRAMQAALKRAGLTPADIDYLNAHGTSTPIGDEIEVTAIKRLFGDSIGNLTVSSTKSAIGHLLGAAGAVEGIFAMLACINGAIPPTLNLDNPSEACRNIDLAAKKAVRKPVRAAMSNSFGFGGTNACIVVKAFEE